ncbi:hypothetical protein LMG28614_04227 [Paraburkholderia ultramafica]|uniref:Uncharacterized protein n=1 Tax=Paraburkholderia ultramafica TaxID=1544867 RepID=A0A6S7D4F6_9BURK|nr:hypothetical protein [Paraburkholderia ultramafica]CAB3795796.1 hypothetical protein LMG28614_04227 [Paraburkholderia ultramafica]
MERKRLIKIKSSQRPIRLRRLLSAHEIAALLVLAAGSVELSAGTPDFLALQNDGLVCVVESRYALTTAGSAVLYQCKKKTTLQWS